MLCYAKEHCYPNASEAVEGSDARSSSCSEIPKFRRTFLPFLLSLAERKQNKWLRTVIKQAWSYGITDQWGRNVWWGKCLVTITGYFS